MLLLFHCDKALAMIAHYHSRHVWLCISGSKPSEVLGCHLPGQRSILGSKSQTQPGLPFFLSVQLVALPCGFSLYTFSLPGGPLCIAMQCWRPLHGHCVTEGDSPDSCAVVGIFFSENQTPLFRHIFPWQCSLIKFKSWHLICRY